MVEILYYLVAAFFEILGCYFFWIVFKDGKNLAYIGTGILSLIIFAFILTRVESEFAGRAYAAYGGIYIFSSLLWLIFVEKQSITKFDIIGVSFVILGACVIIFGFLKKLH
ncbi:YnfA family protein [Campylobacter sp. FMV-PI01]|uniref:YnfA family protein n=1 Tax=Campylobacter portucalensis TaxID=2608384 RepID=A0A6L5WGD8_9BACT|nr:YnfA family protein [Campylobacter portucalensis]